MQQQNFNLLLGQLKTRWIQNYRKFMFWENFDNRLEMIGVVLQ